MSYEERSKIPIEKRLNLGMLKEAEEILKNLYGSNRMADRNDLMNISKTNSGSYLLTELAPTYVTSIDGKIKITETGKKYVENMKPDIKVIDIDIPNEKKEKLQIKEIKKALAAVA